MRQNRFLRTLALGITFSILLIDSPTHAQPTQSVESEPEQYSEAQYSARRLQRIYESALGLLAREDFGNALPLFQSILDQPQDTLFFPDPEDRSQAVSLKGKVVETLASLPAEVLESYDLLYDSSAREILSIGQTGDEMDALEEIVRRYYFTGTGRDAARKLAFVYFDRGNYLSAALTIERLLKDNAVETDRVPGMWYRASLAWHLMGFPSEAKRALSELKRANGGEAFRWGNQSFVLFKDERESLSWLARVSGVNLDPRGESGLENWVMFRGNGARNATSAPAPPIREAEWEFRTIPLSEADDPRQLELVERELQRISESFAGTDYLRFPAMHPLVIDDKVVFRSLGNLKAIELGTGELIWETFKIDSHLEELLSEGPSSFSGSDNQISEIDRLLMQRSWRDVNLGTLSSDGKLVFAIEEQGVVDAVHLYPNRTSGREGKSNNELVAYDLESGKEIWTLGGPATRYLEILGNAIFLGAPLVQGKELYCLIELDDEVHLIALQNRESDTGRIMPVLLWSQPLPIPIASEFRYGNPFGQLAGLSPSYSSGLLVCPTAHGTAIAYDLARKNLKWRYQYTDGMPLGRQVATQLNQVQKSYGLGPEDEGRWIDCVPTVSRGRVLLTPCDSDRLHCLNLTDGSVLWTRPREDDLYLACVDRDRVVLVGRKEIHAVSLETGEEIWSLAISEPSGRGFRADNTYTVPLLSGETVTLDLVRGRLIGVSPLESGRTPGNLVAAGGTIVSQSIDRIFQFESPARLREQIEQNPDREETALLEAEWEIYQNPDGGGIARLQEVYASHPSPRLQTILRRMIFSALEEDFEANADLLGPLAELTRGTKDEIRYREFAVEQMKERDDNENAFAEYLSLAEAPRHFIETNDYLIRSDRWLNTRLSALLEETQDDRLPALEEKVRSYLQSATDENRQLQAEALAGLPGTIAWGKTQIESIDPYTEPLKLEQAVMRLQHHPDEALRRWAFGKHFQLLMKLEHIEEAAVLLAPLQDLYGDEICVDEMTGQQLADWGRQHPRMEEYLSYRMMEWPNAPPQMTASPSQGSRVLGYRVDVIGDSGLFAGWTFEFSHQNHHLVLQDPFGEVRKEIPIPGHSRSQNSYAEVRELMLHGHLAVLKQADHFIVLDLFEGFLHGPHLLRETIAGMELERRRPGILLETRMGLNGHPEKQAKDLLQEEMGEVAFVDDRQIVYQQGNWLHAIDSLTGETIWKRRLPGRGASFFANRDRLAVVDVETRRANLYRISDGKEIGQLDCTGLSKVISNQLGSLVYLAEQADKSEIRCLSLQKNGIAWTVPCPRDALFHLASGNRLAVLDRSRKLMLIKIDTGTIFSEIEIPRNGEPTPAKEGEPAAAKPGDLIAFWVHSLADGVLVTTLEVPDPENEIRVSSFNRTYLMVHGPVMRIDSKGQLLWTKRVENQMCMPDQPIGSPVWVFLARQYPQRRGVVRISPQNYQMELLDLRTGKPVGSEEGVEVNSAVTTLVSPGTDTVELKGNRESYLLDYGPTSKSDSPSSPKP